MEETDKYITMSIYDELCFSGPHPVYTSYGITYLKPDGKKVDLSDFNSDKKDELNKEVENATRSFLQDLLKDDENFDVEELLDLDEDGIDMPEYGFFIKNDSVIFSYQIDELTPYALGMPDVNIPLKELKEKGLLGKTLSDIVK